MLGNPWVFTPWASRHRGLPWQRSVVLGGIVWDAGYLLAVPSTAGIVEDGVAVVPSLCQVAVWANTWFLQQVPVRVVMVDGHRGERAADIVTAVVHAVRIRVELGSGHR
jgi:hypothetical protein